MRASAAFTATAVGDRTRFTSLRSSPPLSLRSTPDGLFLVASGAGPIGGDDLALDCVVQRDASVELRTAGASVVLPGPSGTPSTMTIRATIAGSFVWRPEPTVLVAGSDHRASASVSVAPGGRLWWREEVVLGRHGEASGSLLQRLHVDVDDRPLLRTELPVGPRWPGADGPAGLDGARAVGSILIVGGRVPGPLPAHDGVRAAIISLSDAAWLVTVIGPSASAIRRVLDEVSGCAERCTHS